MEWRDRRVGKVGQGGGAGRVGKHEKPSSSSPTGASSHDEKKRVDAEARKRARDAQARRQRIEQLEGRIAECEAAIRDIEQQMSAAGFYEDRGAAQPVIDQHQALMWKVGDLMHQWEMLQTSGDLTSKH